jgi:hypothetical protein
MKKQSLRPNDMTRTASAALLWVFCERGKTAWVRSARAIFLGSRVQVGWGVQGTFVVSHQHHLGLDVSLSCALAQKLLTDPGPFLPGKPREPRRRELDLHPQLGVLIHNLRQQCSASAIQCLWERPERRVTTDRFTDGLVHQPEVGREQGTSNEILTPTMKY